MKIFLTYFKYEVLKYFIYIILFLWALTMSIVALKKSDKVVYLKLYSDSAEIVTSLSEQELKHLEVIFIKRITQLFYTFNNDNFMTNFDDLKNYFSNSLKEQLIKNSLMKMSFMKDKTVSQTAVIEEIKKSDGKYLITLNVVSQTNSNLLKQKVMVSMRLQKTEKSIENPFGFEITEYEEK